MVSTTVSRPYWLAAIIVVLGVVCVWGASSLPAASRYAGIGPGAFGTAIGVALIGLGIIFAVQIAKGENFVTQSAENADASRPMNRVAFALALAASALPIITLNILGLPLAAMLSFALVARSFGSRTLLRDLVTGLILGSASWFLFDRLGLQLGGIFPLAGF